MLGWLQQSYKIVVFLRNIDGCPHTHLYENNMFLNITIQSGEQIKQKRKEIDPVQACHCCGQDSYSSSSAKKPDYYVPHYSLV